jgi:uncharacterized LabA/DUF88 family protein
MLIAANCTQKVWVDRPEEKGLDVNLASHRLRDACTKKFEVAVLITNDSDLAEPVRIVTQELSLPVDILNPHQFHSRELRQYDLPQTDKAARLDNEPIPTDDH